MKKIIKAITIVLSIITITSCGNLKSGSDFRLNSLTIKQGEMTTNQTYYLPKPKVLIVDKSIPAQQANEMILAAKRYANFWHTGKEKFARQALASDFIDLNLPQGRKQGVQGPLNASKWFRGVVPDLNASIEQMIIAKNKVILQLKFQGHFTGKFHNTIGKGQKIEFSAVDIYTIENGKIKSNWHLEDNQTLMQQLNKYPDSKNFTGVSKDMKIEKTITANQSGKKMNIKFNHIALRCKNIDAIATFFIKVIGLEKGFRPPFAFDGYWLYSPQNKQDAIIHLFGEKANFDGFSSKTNNNNGLLDHIAFSGDSYSSFIQHLINLKISFNENFVPDSNIKQVFLKGPENLTIEIDFINPQEEK